MFRTVRLSIIRSLFSVHSAMVYVIQVCRQLSSRTRMELQYFKKNVKTCIFSVVRNELYASLAVKWCQLQSNTICAAITKFISWWRRRRRRRRRGGGCLKRVFDELNATTLFMEKGGCTEELRTDMKKDGQRIKRIL